MLQFLYLSILLRQVGIVPCPFRPCAVFSPSVRANFFVRTRYALIFFTCSVFFLPRSRIPDPFNPIQKEKRNHKLKVKKSSR